MVDQLATRVKSIDSPDDAGMILRFSSSICCDRQAGPQGQADQGCRFLPARAPHWIRVEGGWVLDLGERKQLVLRQTATGWQVILTNQQTKTFQLRGEHRDIGYGQGIAEEIVREEGLLKIVDKQASWRRGLVTNGQRKALERLRIEASPRNAGEASNLLGVPLRNAEPSAKLPSDQACR